MLPQICNAVCYVHDWLFFELCRSYQDSRSGDSEHCVDCFHIYDDTNTRLYLFDFIQLFVL